VVLLNQQIPVSVGVKIGRYQSTRDDSFTASRPTSVVTFETRGRGSKQPEFLAPVVLLKREIESSVRCIIQSGKPRPCASLKRQNDLLNPMTFRLRHKRNSGAPHK